MCECIFGGSALGGKPQVWCCSFNAIDHLIFAVPG
jgi:hypothetical protein